MEHFYENIQGWFRFSNLYSYMVQIAEPGSHFVEVGAWRGRSAAFMAVEIANSNKDIIFDVVDTWKGSEEHQSDIVILQDILYSEFLTNMKSVEAYYNPLRMTSLEASKIYPDNSLSFVLLDASHDYDSVKEDIKAWLPKVKSGGILAGDDYHSAWLGVVKAVHELLPGFILDNETTWIYKKP